MKKNNSSNLTGGDASFTSRGLEKQESSSSSDSITFSDSKEKLDELKNSTEETGQNKSVPTGLKILSVLSMIGSGFFILVAIVQLLLSLSYQGGELLFNIIISLFIIAFVYKFLGALEMYKGKKSGFKKYIIPSVLMNIIFILSLIGGYQKDELGVTVLISAMIIFAVIFYTYKEHLK